MTVRELKEKLEQFPDNLIVMIPNERLHLDPDAIWCVPATCVARGTNECDGCLFIDDYVEDEDE